MIALNLLIRLKLDLQFFGKRALHLGNCLALIRRGSVSCLRCFWVFFATLASKFNAEKVLSSVIVCCSIISSADFNVDNSAGFGLENVDDSFFTEFKDGKKRDNHADFSFASGK